MSIEAFIEARLAEDERIALDGGERSPNWWTSKDFGGVGGGRVVHPDPNDLEWIACRHTIVYGEGYPLEAEAEHIARHDPARVLRQATAIRHVVERLAVLQEDLENEFGSILKPHHAEAVRDNLGPIAAIWSDHPDFNQEWTA
ncbi:MULTISPECIES: DUF6221 family protein [Nocardia]|uniref:DUF6221 family protein n=1 Tax=Nocardia TaxID=1817 RepID=UPI000D68A59A|nr:MULTISPECIES: DUF6221 family protein [Nocardia]